MASRRERGLPEYQKPTLLRGIERNLNAPVLENREMRRATKRVNAKRTDGKRKEVGG